MADNDIIAELPILTWRGLEAPPYEFVSFEFKNELSPRSVPYVDGEIHDFTGRRSFPMTARLFFLNTIDIGIRLFPDYWEQWRSNLSGEAGDLVHPVLGPMRARVEGARGEIRERTRAGIIVDVTWVETNEDPGEVLIGATLLADPSTFAAQADGNWDFKGRTYPPALLPFMNQFNTTGVEITEPSLLGAYLQIRSLLFAADLVALNALRKLQGIVSDMIGTVELLTDPTEWATFDTLLTFWDLLGTQADRISRAARSTARKVLRFDTTLDAFALEVKNELKEVMALNLFALRSPIVTRGTTLTYFV